MPVLDRAFVDVWAPRAHALLRIVTGFLFLQHGSAKLLGFPGGKETVPIVSLYGLAGVLELVGGLLIVIGLFTRPVAFVLAGEMAVAYFMAHVPQGHLLSPTLNQGEPAVLFCFVFLFLAVAGAGPWSVDAARRGAGVARTGTPVAR
ncbi:MAG TPA: DoxX family protein [Anaeromyxobacteraceae bacterium]|nr:DoxX family protein [Anaeromyxobacteraceae bacterium]